MRVLQIMDENRDTTAWAGVGVMAGLMMGIDPNLERQALVIIVFPFIGWLFVYFGKKLVMRLEGLVTNWWKNRKTKNNNQ